MAGTYEGMDAAQRLARYHQLLASTPEPGREYYKSDEDWCRACAARERVLHEYSREYTTAHLASIIYDEK